MTAGSALNLAYAYNDNGRVSTVTDNVNTAFKTTTYQYDNLNRLTQATAANTSSVTQWQLAWTYDEFGNRLTQTPTGGTPYSPTEVNLTYNAATNRISGYSYDNNGNLLSVSGTALTYDIFDRVTQAVKSGVTSQYAYDAFGRRVAVTVSGSTTVHFFDLNGRLLTNSNVYFAGQRVGQWTDRLGSVRKGSGGDSHYYPYGEEIASTSNNRYKFAETFRDSDTGLDYAKARYLSSSLGRFLNADPYRASAGPADPQSWNRYPYVQNDPINWVDPRGLIRDCPKGDGCKGTPDPGGNGGGAGGIGDGDSPPVEVIDGTDGLPQEGGGTQLPNPRVPLVNPYTAAQMAALTSGFQSAYQIATGSQDCANFFAQNSGAKVEQEASNIGLVADTLTGTTYRILEFLEGPSAGAATQGSTDVWLNTSGKYFNAQPAPNGSVTVGLPLNNGQTQNSTFDSMATFRAFMLLHELGHQMKVYGADLDPVISGRNSQAVLDHCFRRDAQGRWTGGN